MVDLRKTIEAKSDQLNADDLVGNKKILKINKVTLVGGDQPVCIHYDGDEGKPYKPCKAMRRVLIKAWGANGEEFVGKSLEVYNDAKVKWAGQEVGGIRISKMSHIDTPVRMAIAVTRGKRVPFTAEILTVEDPKPERTLDEKKEACKAALKVAGFELTEDDLKELSEIKSVKGLTEFFNSFKKDEA